MSAEGRRTICGRLSSLGLGLFRKQNDPKGLGFDSSAFHQKGHGLLVLAGKHGSLRSNGQALVQFQ